MASWFLSSDKTLINSIHLRNGGRPDSRMKSKVHPQIASVKFLNGWEMSTYQTKCQTLYSSKECMNAIRVKTSL